MYYNHIFIWLSYIYLVIIYLSSFFGRRVFTWTVCRFNKYKEQVYCRLNYNYYKSLIVSNYVWPKGKLEKTLAPREVLVPREENKKNKFLGPRQVLAQRKFLAKGNFGPKGSLRPREVWAQGRFGPKGSSSLRDFLPKGSFGRQARSTPNRQPFPEKRCKLHFVVQM